MLENLAVALFRPKFSENVGSTARAMANMGCSELILVAPQNYNPERAQSLATAHGAEILLRMKVCENLEEALAPFAAVYGTTARVGGWRKDIAHPREMGREISENLAQGAKLALLFGPEDKGLTNAETRLCSRLVRIPTAGEASSLNLAQAVLLTLYECAEAARELNPPKPRQLTTAPSHAEQEAMLEKIKQTLLAVDFLKPDNPEYFMLPLRRFISRIGLKRNEFNLLMGVCRQVNWAIGQFPGPRKKISDEKP